MYQRSQNATDTTEIGLRVRVIGNIKELNIYHKEYISHRNGELKWLSSATIVSENTCDSEQVVEQLIKRESVELERAVVLNLKIRIIRFV